MRFGYVIFCLLCACTSRPDVDALLGPEPAGTAYPALLPLDDVLATETVDEEAQLRANAALEARAAALRARAAQLSQ